MWYNTRPMDAIDFNSDSFSDIMAKDDRYQPRAYALLMDVVQFLGTNGKPMTSEDIMDEFRDRTLDLFGPLSLAVLREWGVTKCEDLGEMMVNLAETHRVGRNSGDKPDDFVGGYDFQEAFLDPYAV